MCPMTHHRVHLYVPDDTLAKIDRMRGPTPRSAYLRWLIDREPEVSATTESEAMLGAPVKRIKVVKTEEPHEHTWIKTGLFDRCTDRKCEETRPHQAGTK